MAKGTIVIVDDHIDTVDSLSFFLESKGFRTKKCYEGKSAVKACEEEKPNLLLVDVRMRGMDGFEVVKSLPKQKFVFMTGFDDIKEEDQSKYPSCKGVLTKPVDLEDLLKIVKSAVK